MFQTYGMTETCGGIAYDGVPLADVDVRIGDGGAASSSRSPMLFSGYRHDPQATAEAFTVDGWFRTRDLGSVDDDGLVTVHGRADDAIRTGGETVWPEEVEAVLRAHPAVADVAVAGRPDPGMGQPRGRVGGAGVRRRTPVARDAPRPTAASTSRGSRSRRRSRSWPTLARTTTGKIRRDDLS